jgi:Rrf2 family protein
MRLSTRARYAMRMMVQITRHTGDGTAMSLGEVSENARISRRYLEQLVITMKNASLVRGIAGKGGGYILTRSATDITLRQIVEAAIGPINVVECVLDPEICIESDCCECRFVYRTINERIVRVLDELSLDDISHQSRAESPLANLIVDGSSCPTRAKSADLDLQGGE